MSSSHIECSMRHPASGAAAPIGSRQHRRLMGADKRRRAPRPWLPVTILVALALFAWTRPANASIYCTAVHDRVCDPGTGICCEQFCRYCYDTDTEELVSDDCTDPVCDQN
jgi:hypothetical protein